MVCDTLKVRLDLGSEGARLFSELEMVVEDLAFLVGGQVVNIDHDLTFLQQRKRALLQVLPRAVVDVVARSHDDLRPFAQHRPDLRQDVIPAVDQKIFVLRHAESVIQPEELRRLVRVPVLGYLAGIVELEHRRVPLVECRHRQQRCDGRLASRRLADEQAQNRVC